MVGEPQPLSSRSSRLKTKRALVVAILALIALVASGLWLAWTTWSAVHTSLSYSSYYFAELRFERNVSSTNYVIWVGMNFVGDGPIVAGQPLNLVQLQVTGLLPQPASRVIYQIVMPNVYPSWPTVNRSVSSPDPSQGYVFENVGSGGFRRPGTSSFFALLEVWVGSTQYSFSNPQDVSPTNLTVFPADVWSEYNARRLTAATAVLGLLVTTVPISIKASWDVLRPFARWLRLKTSTAQLRLEDFVGDGIAGQKKR